MQTLHLSAEFRGVGGLCWSASLSNLQQLVNTRQKRGWRNTEVNMPLETAFLEGVAGIKFRRSVYFRKTIKFISLSVWMLDTFSSSLTKFSLFQPHFLLSVIWFQLFVVWLSVLLSVSSSALQILSPAQSQACGVFGPTALACWGFVPGWTPWPWPCGIHPAAALRTASRSSETDWETAASSNWWEIYIGHHIEYVTQDRGW